MHFLLKATAGIFHAVMHFMHFIFLSADLMTSIQFDYLMILFLHSFIFLYACQVFHYSCCPEFVFDHATLFQVHVFPADFLLQCVYFVNSSCICPYLLEGWTNLVKIFQV